MSLPPQKNPEMLGRYQLIERLAIGGMAEVFLACERGAHDFERIVVVKRMLPHLAEDPKFVEMFLHEAKIAARISHPNVIQILELGEHSGAPFIAMEYIDGSTLRDLLVAADRSKNHIPFSVVVHLMSQTLAGAHAVHELRAPDGSPLGLVHRDLSPHNLMVTENAHIKLLDFGIVKSDQSEHTRTGVLKGKLSYMSPEQCQQKSLDRRSDIFALGIVMWELLAGTKMMSGKPDLAVMQAIVTGNLPKLNTVRPANRVPIPLQQVVKRALEVNRDLRYPTADAMRKELLQAASQCDLTVDPDFSADFIQDMLGDSLERRKQRVQKNLEKTATSFHQTSSEVTQTGMHSTAQVGFAGLAGVFATVIFFLGIGFALIGGYALLTFEPVNVYQPPKGEPVAIAWAPTLDAAILLDELEPLRLYLEQGLNRPVAFKVGQTYKGTLQQAIDGDVLFASLPPYIYSIGHSKDPKLNAIAIQSPGGSSGTDGILIVHDTNDAQSLADLKNKVMCYSDRSSTTGYLFPRSYLRSQGHDPNTLFKRVVFSGNHLQVIRDVADGKCDVGGTYSGAFTTAAQAGVAVAKARFFDRTGRSPHDAFCTTGRTPPALAKKVQRLLLDFSPQVAIGKPFLGEVQQLSGFSAAKDNTYAQIDRAIAEENDSSKTP